MPTNNFHYVKFDGDSEVYERIKCGDKYDLFEHQNQNFVCGDCGATMGEYHDINCDCEIDPRDHVSQLISSEEEYEFFENLDDAKATAAYTNYVQADPEAGLYVLAAFGGAAVAYGGYRAVKSVRETLMDIRDLGGFKECIKLARLYKQEHGIR